MHGDLVIPERERFGHHVQWLCMSPRFVVLMSSLMLVKQKVNGLFKCTPFDIFDLVRIGPKSQLYLARNTASKFAN